jgi:hypothetical protein
MFQIEVISEDSTEPVTLTEVKDFLRIDSDSSSDDSVLELMIVSCREKLEGFTNLYFIPKEVQIEFSSRVFELPYGPAGAITELTRQVNDETPVVVDPSKYYTTGLAFKTLIIKEFDNEGGGWWYPIDGSWPIWQGTIPCFEKYVLSLTTGYETLPKALKHALLLQIDYDYKWQGKQEKEDISPAAVEQASRFSRNLVL